MKCEPRPLVAGNWKMNGTMSAMAQIEALGELMAAAGPLGVDVVLCPPATILGALWARQCEGGGGLGDLMLGAQTCHAEDSGAHTGDLSAPMLRDAGAQLVIVGHSERRADHGETSEDVAAKARAAWRAGLIAVICVGETLGEREAGEAVDLVTGQLAASVPDGANGDNTVIAYEPVWAIGTGKTPTVGDIAQMHAAIRHRLEERFGAGAAAMRILYGGSVKPDNAIALLGAANVDGALVGGASLKAKDLWGILQIYL
ncbi:Triosephosphate isomerase [hydrothermal vent metagenome]|uniref:triose-phosphate isomerase n=1 Tax=hydrothermal vent metagenome TaxID=652676 RepID=A0A3B0TE54_9ZZZZ